MAGPGTRSGGRPDGPAPALPRLAAGRRRLDLALLVGLALAHSALAVAVGLLVGGLLAGAGVGPGAGLSPAGALALLGACVAGIAGARYAERVVAERLGQDYVQQLRLGLVEHAMTAGRAPNLGITIARSTNDLSSIRNWVSQGIAPLTAAVPMVAGCVAALAVLAPALGLAVGVPLAVLGAGLAVLSGPAYARARELRRQRGALAARVADTTRAALGIDVAGGTDRELKAVQRAGEKVVAAAVRRARAAGALRALSMAAPVAASGGVAAVAAAGWADTAQSATALTVVGIMSGPVAELGRVVEYRQNQRAARRIVAPLLAEAERARSARPAGPRPDPAPSAGGRVIASRMAPGGLSVPDLSAVPGDRILATGPASRIAEVFSLLSAPHRHGTVLLVDGKDLAACGPRTRRAALGHAGRAPVFERGTIARAARYRRPDLDPAAATAALERVGLGARLKRLERGERTVLRRGGEPLTGPEAARLALARATLGEPPLLLLENLDADLEADGIPMLADVLAGYPGVVVAATADPSRLGGSWRRWDVGLASGREVAGPGVPRPPAPLDS